MLIRERLTLPAAGRVKLSASQTIAWPGESDDEQIRRAASSATEVDGFDR
jgi:hypothetical protein